MTAASADPVFDFNVRRIEQVTLDASPDLAARDLMSPYVWRERDGRYGIMVRAVVPPGAPLTVNGTGFCRFIA